MAEVEPQSIKSRIAALNLEKVHSSTPGTRPTYSYDAVPAAKKKPPPPPPANRPPQWRSQTTNNPPLLDSSVASTHDIGNQPNVEKPPPRVSPALPPRPPPRPTSQKSPALPPRQSSDRSISRRESSESISTIASGVSTLSLGSVKTNGSSGSTLYQVRAPAYDPSKLPPLPLKKQEEQKSATRLAMTSKRNVVTSRELPPPVKPSPPCEFPELTRYVATKFQPSCTKPDMPVCTSLLITDSTSATFQAITTTQAVYECVRTLARETCSSTAQPTCSNDSDEESYCAAAAATTTLRAFAWVQQQNRNRRTASCAFE